MKAITLHQPWASLVGLVKWIETRSWPAPAGLIDQPLLIHAGTKAPREDQKVGDFTCHLMAGDWWSMTEGDRFIYLPLPLGAVVATCRLAACVPIVERATDMHPAAPMVVVGHRLDYLDPTIPLGEGWRNMEHERPYGDFTPGRWAWLLADVEPLADPVPAKGRQGVWTWEAPDA